MQKGAGRSWELLGSHYVIGYQVRCNTLLNSSRHDIRKRENTVCMTLSETEKVEQSH